MAMVFLPTFFSWKKAAPAAKLTMTLLRRIMEISDSGAPSVETAKK